MIDRKRIARNTLILYLRMGLIMLISLYASRVVLDTLGETDFGLYNVIGGIVVAFSFLGSVMNSACNRYYSVALGEQDESALHKIFCINVAVFAVLAVAILLLAETLGEWILTRKMIIPADRTSAAQWVFQLSILSFLAGVVAIPYKAIITAKEKMKVYAYCSVVEAVLKLAIVFLLAVSPIDRLVFYAALMLVVSVVTNAIYIIYCRRNYRECRESFVWDAPLAREIIGFNAWGVIGSMATIGKNQGVNILLNMFYGPAVNAARGIANQVYVNVYQFVQNYVLAFNPQIVKSYAAGERKEMTRLVFQSSKFSFFLLYIIVLPLLLEMEQVLDIWLVSVPAHAPAFASIMLASALVDSMHDPLFYSVQATGKVKWYNILVGSSQLMIVIVAYLVLKFAKVEPELVFWIIFGFTCLAQLIRILLTRRHVGMSLREYLRKAIVPVVAVALISAVAPVALVKIMAPSLGRLFLTIAVSVVCVAAAVFAFGLEKKERRELLNLIKKNGRA